METELLQLLGDGAVSTAVVVIVVIFMRYIKERDKQFTEIIGDHMNEEIRAFTQLVEIIKVMRDDIKK